MLLALIKNTQIMAVEYMKKVGIHVIYVERCRVLKIFPTFIAGSMGTALKSGAKIRTNNTSRLFNNSLTRFGASLIPFRACGQTHTSSGWEGKKFATSCKRLALGVFVAAIRLEETLSGYTKLIAAVLNPMRRM